MKPRECCSGIFIVNFEHVSHHFLVFLMLTCTSKFLLGSFETDCFSCFSVHKSDGCKPSLINLQELLYCKDVKGLVKRAKIYHFDVLFVLRYSDIR